MTFFRRLATELDPQVLIISPMTFVILLESSVGRVFWPYSPAQFSQSGAYRQWVLKELGLIRSPINVIARSPRLNIRSGRST